LGFAGPRTSPAALITRVTLLAGGDRGSARAETPVLGRSQLEESARCLRDDLCRNASTDAQVGGHPGFVMKVEHSYRIVVAGELGGWLARYVGDATIESANGITTIAGSLHDPSQLQALTETLCDLGLEIESAALL
jgi:hypothetical protein